MTYLYGDSTDSGLELNYIELSCENFWISLSR